MKIVSIIDGVFDGSRRSREVAGLEGIMVHRVGVDHQTGTVIGYDGLSICEAFTGRRKEFAGVAAATGGENAYSFLVGGDCGPRDLDGVVWQSLPIDEVGYHARRFSRRYVGVACIGDFREKYDRPPSLAQLTNAVELVAELSIYLGAERVVGHGEVKGSHGGEKAPGRPAACPGELLDMDSFRDAVAARVSDLCGDSAMARLSAAGLVFPTS